MLSYLPPSHSDLSHMQIDASCVMSQQVEPVRQLDASHCSHDELQLVRKQLAYAHSRKTFINLMLLQDFADATIAVNEVTGTTPAPSAHLPVPGSWQMSWQTFWQASSSS